MNDELLIRILVWIVTPFGSALWAFWELGGNPTQLGVAFLFLVVMVGTAIAFRTSITILNERLNQRPGTE